MIIDKSKKKGWFGLIFVVFCWMLIFSLAKDLTKVGSGFKRIDETNERLKEAEKQNIELKKKMVLVQTDYYKEKIVREKLNMQKPGETVVVLADKTTQMDNKADSEVGEIVQTANWEKWWALIQ